MSHEKGPFQKKRLVFQPFQDPIIPINNTPAIYIPITIVTLGPPCSDSLTHPVTAAGESSTFGVPALPAPLLADDLSESLGRHRPTWRMLTGVNG